MATAKYQFRIVSRSIIIMMAVVLFTALSGFIFLYRASYNSHKSLLQHFVQSRALLMDTVAREDDRQNKELGLSPEQARASTIRQLQQGLEFFTKFGSTGEVILGERQGNRIVYLSASPIHNNVVPEPVAWETTQLAEPMRLALSGKTGVIEALDFSGEPVIAAYAFLPYLKMGLVSKIDKIEITEPFRQGGLLALAIAVVTILIGACLSNRLIGPLVTDLQNYAEKLKQAELSSRAAKKRQRLILDSTAEGIYGLDLNGNCIFCNKSALKMLGYGHWSEVLDRDMHDLIHHTGTDGSPLPITECPIHKALSNGQGVYIADNLFWRQDGTSFPVEYWSYPIIKDGILEGAVVTFNDITERKITDYNLRLQKERMESLLSLSQRHFASEKEIAQFALEEAVRISQSRVGFWHLYDETNRIVTMNLWSASLIAQCPVMQQGHYPLDEAGTWSDCIRKRRPVIENDYQDMPDKKGYPEWHFPIRRYMTLPIFKEGRIVAVAGIANRDQPYDETEALQLTLFFDMAWNIIKKKQAEEELVSAKEKAEAATRAKSNFLANMSHEIRTPMNAILGMTHLCLRTGLAPNQLHYLNKVNEAARSLLGILNDILDFSKIEAGKVSLESIDFNLYETINHVNQMMLPKIREKNLALSCTIARETPCSIKGDPLRLGQILLNLLSNAVKFTEKGEVAIDVSPISYDSGKVLLRFCVHDTGIGMTPAQVSELFQPFSQADASTTRRFGGTGLGLAISRQLVELMGGRMSVDSELNEGSLFSFSLPFKLADEPVPLAEIPAPFATSASATDHTTTGTLENKTSIVLLAEDNEINRLVVSELLTQAGIKVDTVENGRQVVEAALSRKYDLILMDIQMPEMDGLAATQAIRAADSPYRNVPIVAITAHAMFGDRENSLAAGMNDHIVKPIEPDELYRVLTRWLRPEGRQQVQHINMRVPDPPLSLLAGIDMEDGLKRTAGNLELYTDILRRFGRENQNTIARLRQALLGDKLEEAIFLIHTVKGVAGNIGAKPVQLAAADLENALRRRAAGKYEERLAVFAAALAEVLQGMEIYFATRPSVVKEFADKPPGNATVLRALLHELAPQLRQRRPKECEKTLEKLKSYAWPVEHAQEVDQCLDLTRRYRFKEAEKLLDAVLEKIKFL